MHFRCFVLSIFVLLLINCCNGKLLDLIELDLKPDLNAPSCQLSDPNQVLQDQNGNYVLIDSGTVTDVEFTRKSAQLLSSIGYKVCTVPTGSLASDVVLIRAGGFQSFYYGKRDANTLVRYVQQLSQQIGDVPFRTIVTKIDKKAFEHIVVPKVLAYFPDATAPAFTQFQLAAGQLAPTPPFYVVHDPLIAAKFRLSQPGQMALIRRLEKSTVFFTPTASSVSDESSLSSAPVLTAQEIIYWVNSNRGLVLHELDDTNLYDPELSDVSKYQLVAIGDKTTPLGLYFYKILKKTIQNITNENDLILNPVLEDVSISEQSKTTNDLSQVVKLDDIEIVWIDLQKYPTAGLKLIQENVSPKNVWFCLVQVPNTDLTLQSCFDVSSFNVTGSDKRNDELNIHLLRNWILSATNRNQLDQSTLSESNPLAQSFILEPEEVLVRQGGNFMLDCKVANKIGECSWTKNDVLLPIGDAPYNWVQSGDSSDCSISVTNADLHRDQGIWRCQVSSNGQIDGITSKPVTVTVRSAPNKGEL